MEAKAGGGYDFLQTAIGVFEEGNGAGTKDRAHGVGDDSLEVTGLNLPENSDSSKQQEILDALPVLIFLEQAGKIVLPTPRLVRCWG